MAFSKNSRILVLGGCGLVGMNVVLLLQKKGFKNISIVSLNDKAAQTRIRNLKNNTGIKVYLGNILLCNKISGFTLKQLLVNKNKTNHLLKYLSKSLKESYSDSFVVKIIESSKADVIIDCVNTATITAYISKNKTAGLYFDKIDLGLKLLFKYYQHLNCLFSSKENTVKEYIKIGTSGIGGMGFDIPFTHGEEKPSNQLLMKIAIAGAQTMLLFALKNTKNFPIIKEIKPATAIFDTEPKETKLRDITNRELQITNIGGLNKKDILIADNRIQPDIYMDGGESGYYSLDEFRVLTNPTQMGLVSSQTVAKIVYDEMMGFSNRDVLTGIHKYCIRGSNSSTLRNNIFKQLNKRANKIIISKNLGPAKISKLILESYLYLKLFNSKSELIKSGKQALIDYIINNIRGSVEISRNLSLMGMPIILEDKKVVLFGKIIVPPEYGAKWRRSNFVKLINEVWIDMRVERLMFIDQVCKKIHNTNTLQPSDIVLYILQHYEK